MENNAVKEILKKAVHISDKDWETFQTGSPGVYKFFTRLDAVMATRIVAEVVSSTYCAAGLRTGQRYVIEAGALIPEKSTAPFCMRALGPLTGFVNTIFEKVVAGEDPNDRVFMTAECLDPGLEAGGLGKVKFRVFVESS